MNSQHHQQQQQQQHQIQFQHQHKNAMASAVANHLQPPQAHQMISLNRK
jgi:hypothetical protein